MTMDRDEWMDIEAAKMPYSAPGLVRYGAIRELTQTGSGQASESGGMDVMNCTSGYKSHDACFGGMSDRRVKENIVRVGTHPLGVGLYLFDYQQPWRDSCGHGRQFGVMADEVETVMPDAVSIHPAGYRQVNYAMLGIERVVNYLQ